MPKKRWPVHANALNPMIIENSTDEINAAFPPQEMPEKADILFYENYSLEKESLLEDIEEFRGKNPNADLIRLIHQELSYLSAKFWRWVLPTYMKFCLSPDGKYSSMETQFLIFNLNPRLEFQAKTRKRLSALSAPQIECVIQFLELLSIDEFWQAQCPDEISGAIKFLKNL